MCLSISFPLVLSVFVYIFSTRFESIFLQNGAGGNYTWGKPEDVVNNPVPAAIDKKDPNYDSEQEQVR